MTYGAWHPYAPDQAFGRGIAANERLLDQLIASLDAAGSAAPRAGNKAGVVAAVPSPLPLAAWLGLVAGKGLDEPVTTASALEAAVEQHESASGQQSRAQQSRIRHVNRS